MPTRTSPVPALPLSWPTSSWLAFCPSPGRVPSSLAGHCHRGLHPSLMSLPVFPKTFLLQCSSHWSHATLSPWSQWYHTHPGMCKSLVPRLLPILLCFCAGIWAGPQIKAACWLECLECLCTVPGIHCRCWHLIGRTETDRCPLPFKFRF